MEQKYQCPHCGTYVEHGFTVCRGCGAEVIYGATGQAKAAIGCLCIALFFPVAIVGLTVAVTIAAKLGITSAINWIGIGVFAGAIFAVVAGAIIGCKLADRIWKGVRFIRDYRHR